VSYLYTPSLPPPLPPFLTGCWPLTQVYSRALSGCGGPCFWQASKSRQICAGMQLQVMWQTWDLGPMQIGLSSANIQKLTSNLRAWISCIDDKCTPLIGQSMDYVCTLMHSTMCVGWWVVSECGDGEGGSGHVHGRRGLGEGQGHCQEHCTEVWLQRQLLIWSYHWLLAHVTGSWDVCILPYGSVHAPLYQCLAHLIVQLPSCLWNGTCTF